MRWILDNVDGARERAEAGDLLFGNMDTWLIWNLTGGTDGGLHITDVTNASRTLLMDLETLDWDDALCEAIGVPRAMLPEIRSSSDVYGEVKSGGGLQGVQIAGDLGDQQAATFGQTCFSPGEAKNTYGTGNFLLLNTGTDLVQSKNGLLTTVGYKIGDQDAIYCLEGSIAITGALVQWLRDNLKLIKAAPEVEELARSVDDNGGCYIVPGVLGPVRAVLEVERPRRRRRPDALRQRRATSRAPTLEATAFQSREVVEAMNQDSGVDLESLKVDGGMVQNDLLMQFQADLLGVPVIRAGGRGDDRAGRRLRGRPGDRLLERDRGPARELGRGQALGAADGLREARRVLQVLEARRHADVRLVRRRGRGAGGLSVARRGATRPPAGPGIDSRS